MSQEQAPPEVCENLPHPSGDGRGLGTVELGWAGPSSPTRINLSVLPGHGEGAARLGWSWWHSHSNLS